MADQSFTELGNKAYLAGRELAKVLSVDPDRAAVPAQYSGEERAYRAGILDEQNGVAADAGSRPTAAAGASPQPAAPADTGRPPVAAPALSRTQLRQQQYKRFYQGLVKQPTEVLREVAQRQISQVDAAYAAAPRVKQLEFLRPDYAAARQDLEGARQRLAEGEALAAKPDPQSQADRRTAYLRAYNSAYTAGEALSSIVKDESFLVLVTSEVVVPAVQDAAQVIQKAGSQAIDAAKMAAEGIGSTAKIVLYGLTGAAGLALIGFALQRGKRR